MKKKGLKPPGLTTSQDKQNCGKCKHFDGVERCLKFGYPVRPFHICDAFTAKKKVPSKRDPTGTVQVNVNVGTDGDDTAGA